MKLIILLAVFLFLIFGLSGLWRIAAGEESAYAYGSKRLDKIVKRHKDKHSPWEQAPLKDLLTAVGHVIPVDPERIEKENGQLDRAGMNYTAQEYEAKKFIFIATGLLFTAAIYATGLLIAVPVGILLTLLLYFKTVEDLTKKLRRNDTKALQELPQFIQAILAGIKTDRDIIRVVERYIPLAGQALKPEITALAFSMHTGGVEKALRHFDNRMGLPEISRLVTILTNVERGIDQSNALEFLTADMLLLAAENVTRQLALRPPRLKRALVPCVIVMAMGLLYMLIGNIFTYMQF